MTLTAPILTEQPLLISNPLQTQVANLVWQSPKEHTQGTGRRYCVGRLRADPDSDDVIFSYLAKSEDFRQAKKMDLMVILEFLCGIKVGTQAHFLYYKGASHRQIALIMKTTLQGLA